MAKPLITLTTDFGLSDHFVGAMKGVILSISPDARIVDISHEVTQFEPAEGAFVISQAYRCFPRRTVHLVVVDPGVGTARRPILLEAAGQLFVAPDNGVLAMVYGKEKHVVREISAAKYFRRPVSATFHGRDIFAPVAAHLAAGARPAQFGKKIQDYLKPAFGRPQRTGKRTWTGAVLKVDRFGNLITNFDIEEFASVRERPFILAVGVRQISDLAPAYGSRPIGEVFAIAGSSGYLEVAANQASAARILGCGTGSPLELTAY